MSKEGVDLAVRNTNSPQFSPEVYIPLIHTLLEFYLAQSVVHSQWESASGFVERGIVGSEVAGRVVAMICGFYCGGWE